jgi:methyltransferase (TIGR00027 family)
MSRTQDDTWDVSASVGETALGIAHIRAIESTRQDAAFIDPYARVLFDAVNSPSWSTMANAGVSAGGAGLAAYVVARTKYFDDYLMDSVDSLGIRQVVTLAAGLDSRPYRLAWPTDTMLFEIDQPTILDFKETTLRHAGIQSMADYRQVGQDLRSDWAGALLANGFDTQRPTAWLVEGLLPYLKPRDQDALFATIVELSAPGSRVAVDDFGHTDIPRFRSATTSTGNLERSSYGVDLGGSSSGVAGLMYLDESRRPASEWFAARDWQVSGVRVREAVSTVNRSVPREDELGLFDNLLFTAHGA